MGIFSLPKYPTFVESYISGFPFCHYKTTVTLSITTEGIDVKILVGFKNKKFTILKNDIVELGLNQETYRSAGKAAVGAVVGGILTGGIGLLAGAVIGGKRRKDNELLLAVNYEGQLCYIELKPSKTIPKLYQEIKKIMPIVNNNQVLGSADELQKFADLRDQGIITNNEFEAKKKQILGL